MSQIVVGKLLPNLKVTLEKRNDVSENATDEENDFELSNKNVSDSSDNSNLQIVRSWMESLPNPKIYKNKSGEFTTGLDLLSEDNTEKLGKRAERFGLEKDESSHPLNLRSLYESMDLSMDRNSAKMKNIRLNALHMRGVNELNTKDVFQYFIEYGPSSVEWINDFSCNVVWLDEISCARALIGISKPLSQCKTYTVEDKAQSDSDESVEGQKSRSPLVDDKKEEDTEMDTDGISQVKSTSLSEAPLKLDIPVPPGHWRLGVPFKKAKTILLRFATKDDKKFPGAEKRSDYYKKYGNPNYGGLKGLISSSRKRKMQAALNKRAIESESTKSKTTESQTLDAVQSDEFVPRVSNPKPPRMRMYADDEEVKTRELRPSNNIREKPKSIHSRLGTKYTRDDLCRLGSYGTSERNYSNPEDGDYDHSDNERSFPRRNENMQQNLDDDEEEESEDSGDDSYYSRHNRQNRKRKWSSENQIDLRTKLKKLRSGLVNKHRSPLCIDTESKLED